jgi:hypothetical protein
MQGAQAHATQQPDATSAVPDMSASWVTLFCKLLVPLAPFQGQRPGQTVPVDSPSGAGPHQGIIAHNWQQAVAVATSTISAECC